MKRFSLLLVSLLLSSTFLSCAPASERYLRHHVGQATQDDVVVEMGQPAKKESLSGGSQWVYHDHVSYATYLTYSNPDAEVCYTYVLTFDARNVLQSWNKSSRNCGAVN